MPVSDEKRGVEKSLYEAGEDPDDPWPHEPDEFDPHSLGPGGDPGATDAEDAGQGDDRPEVDRETFRAFWGAVVVVNVGLFLVSVGPMLVYFRGQTALGGGMALAGLGAFVHAYVIYRRYRTEGDGDPEASGSADGAGASGATDEVDAS